MKKTIYILIAVFGLGILIKVLTSSNPAAQTQASVPIAATVSTKTKDGTFTGDTISTEYGPVQVAVILSAGIIKDVTFIQLPSDRQHSADLSSMSKPVLLQETLKAQSATVDAVSGASQTSEAYVQSLGSALAKAQ